MTCAVESASCFIRSATSSSLALQMLVSRALPGVNSHVTSIRSGTGGAGAGGGGGGSGAGGGGGGSGAGGGGGGRRRGKKVKPSRPPRGQCSSIESN